MKKSLLVLTFLFSGVICSFGQGLNAERHILRILDDKQLLHDHDITYENIAGSPFLFDDFTPAIIEFLDNTLSAEPVPIQIDLYANKVLFKAEEKIYELNTDVHSIIIDDRTYVPISGSNDFVEQLYNKNGVKLYKKHSVSFHEQQDGGQYGVQKGDQFVIDKPIYSLELKSGETIVLKTNKKVKQFFKGKAADVYIKKNGVNVSNDYSLINLASFLAEN